MAMKVEELVRRLQELPPGWAVRATGSGRSLEVWEPGGFKWGYVFTDEPREVRMMNSATPLRVLDPEEIAK